MNKQEILQAIEQAAKEQIEVLDFSSTQLTLLPPEIGKLKNLTWLDLSNNQLEELPPEIGQLENLTWLEAYNNQLKKIPVEITNLSNLAVLNLRNNQLEKLPKFIGNLQELIQLNLEGNNFRRLPLSLGELQNLEWLCLSGNELQGFPTGIKQLKNLVWLDLSNNRLKTLPDTIGTLDKLSSLNLSNNNLQSLPNKFSSLENIKELFLQDNHLTKLPSSLEKLLLERNDLNPLIHKKIQINLSGNQLSIPFELLAGGHRPETVTNYYLKQKGEPQQFLNEVKMLLVGQGGVGKSSLVRRLVRGDFFINEDKTEGIDIQRWKVNIGSRKIHVNIWDFGGQEIMHATHQFFLTKRSLYLLLVDSRLGGRENRIEYWLKIIQSFGGNSPVIIVANKIDQHPPDFDQNGLKRKYRNIRRIVEVSCKTRSGLKRLRSTITQEISSLEHINDSLLVSWFKVKSHLEKLSQSENYITYSTYEKICQSENIEDHHGLIQLLNDLGIVLNFREDLRLGNICILNPKWIIEGIYKILNDNLLMTQDKGILSFETLDRILDSGTYPNNRKIYVIDLMRKFELCFELDCFTNQKFLIPALLPREEPFTGDWNNTLLFEYHYSVLPASIISRFMVKMNDKIHEKTYWRNGLVLKYEDNIALVKADYEDKKICIFIGGNKEGRREALTTIRSVFQAIHKGFQNLFPKGKIPIPDNPEVVVDYQHLCTLERANVVEHIFEGCEKSLNVKALLNGIESQEISSLNLQNSQNAIVLPHINININNNNSQEDGRTVSNTYQNHSGSGDNVAGDKNVSNIRNSQSLTQAAKDIQELLDQLSQDYSNAALVGAKAIEEVERNPTLKTRLVNAIREGGTTAIEKLVEHPAASIIIAAVKGGMQS
ncbi:COR domain-containing protein [Leptothoe sp. LEGE 181152]|nr:COR domain-containing protein [Leptothoe sp. LEGE 181152]